MRDTSPDVSACTGWTLGLDQPAAPLCWDGRRARPERPVQCVTDLRRHRQVPVSLVGGVDDEPGCVSEARALNQPFGRRAPPVVLAVLFPLGLRHAPAGQRVLGELLQPSFLVTAGHVHPEFQDQGTVGRQRLFELGNPVEGGIELGECRPPGDAADERYRIPRAHEQAHLAVGREREPEAPERRAFTLVLGKLVERPVDDAPGIHPRVEELNRLALARAIGPAEQDDERKACGLEQALGVQQFPSQLRHLGLVVRLRDRPTRLCCFEHRCLVLPRRRDGESSQPL